MNLLRMKARPLLAAPFIIDGFSAVITPAPHVEKVELAWNSAERLGLPPLDSGRLGLATRLSGAITVGTAIYFVVGKHKRTAAALLAGLTIPLAVANAPLCVVGDKDQRRAATHTMVDYGVMLAGMLLASTDRVGAPSQIWKRNFLREQREMVASIAEETLAVGKSAR